MPIYRIAKLNIQIDPLYSQTEKRLAPFLSQTADYDFDASASAEEVKSYIEEKEPCPPYLAEGAIILTKICKTVLSDYSGMFFHSSSLMLDGEAYLFTALSGTGKSGTNIDVPIKAVYVLQRGEKNTAERVSTARVFKQLLEATLVPNTAENMQKLLELFDGLFSSVPLFLLSCNTDEEAAQVAYNAANKE